MSAGKVIVRLAEWSPTLVLETGLVRLADFIANCFFSMYFFNKWML